MNKPEKPNIIIPESFAENGVKTDFDSNKILNGFDRIQPDVLAGDNLNKFIDDTYKGLNYALNFGDYIDTKVSKSGDTMTGNLHISSNQPTFYLKNKDFDFTSIIAPSTDQILSSILYIDKNGNYYNYCQTRFATNNTLNTSLGVRRLIDGIEHTNNIGVGITAEGTKFTYAPTPPLSDNSTKIATTEFCDGNWVNKYFRIANEVEIAPGATKTYSLSSYLPNDGNKYEVLLTGYGKTHPSTGSSMYLSLDSDFITSDAMVVHSYASANYKVHSAFSFTTISSTGRSINVTNGSNAVNNSVFDIRAIGYRRVR